MEAVSYHPLLFRQEKKINQNNSRILIMAQRKVKYTVTSATGGFCQCLSVCDVYWMSDISGFSEA